MKKLRVLNLGAGVQSTMLYLLACQKHSAIGHIDFAIFADVGDEPLAVYKHLAWLKSLDGPEILVRSKGSLGDAIIYGDSKYNKEGKKRFVSIPAFTSLGAMGRRQCTYEFKINVIRKTIRKELLGLKPYQNFPQKEWQIDQLLGLSLDELKRVERVQKRFLKTKWTKPFFPLVELNATRTNCKNWLTNEVPHKVPRSSCVFCPFHSKKEWAEVAAVPEDLARAIEVDEGLRSIENQKLRKVNELQFVHRKRKPLKDIDLTLYPETLEMGFLKFCEKKWSLNKGE